MVVEPPPRVARASTGVQDFWCVCSLPVLKIIALKNLDGTEGRELRRCGATHETFLISLLSGALRRRYVSWGRRELTMSD